jgi:hypothetical protein
MYSLTRVTCVVTALLAATWATPILAAPGSDPLNTPQGGGLPDVQAIAHAYGDLSVFVLNVAAGHDGQPRDPAGEQAFANAFAQQVLTVYPSLPPEQQQSLSELPTLDAELRQLWPTLPVEQRQGLQQQFATGVEATVLEVPCDVYDALARAYLVPYDPARDDELVDHLVQCWREHPELAKSRDGRDLAPEMARRQTQSGGVGSHEVFVGMMNAQTIQHAGTMNMISIMSGDPYRWTVK